MNWTPLAEKDLAIVRKKFESFLLVEKLVPPQQHAERRDPPRLPFRLQLDQLHDPRSAPLLARPSLH